MIHKKRRTLGPLLFIGLLFIEFLNVQYASAQHSDGLKAITPRMRVIVDNDFAGDPDGIFQLVHQVLSPSVEIRGIIGSHLKPGDVFDSSDQTATNAVKNIEEVLSFMGMKDKYNILQGSNKGLTNPESRPQPSPATQFIIDEAMRIDDKRPLYILCGGGLTEIAIAYLIEPRIADHITLVWIGGTEYPDLATPPPGYTQMEYNTGIDVYAAQVIFNQSNIPVWQIPRNIYRQTLISYAELMTKLQPGGTLGKYLFDKLSFVYTIIPAETYILGDSPLVLLTALQSIFEPDASSSDYVIKQTPFINEKGLYEVNRDGRPIKVFKRLDTRLTIRGGGR